jgi:hypothetical protein
MNIIKQLFIIATLLPAIAFCFDHTHAQWNIVLKASVKLDGKQSLINYALVKKKHSAQLNAYLAGLSGLAKSDFQKFNDDQKLAFLINAYNAFTVKLIVDNYPLKSIKDIGSIFKGPWSQKFFKLFGKDTTLDNIEHDIIRKQFPKEPRIHFAVNCASFGCPNLAADAFTVNNLEKLLAAGTQSFVNDSAKNYYHASEKTLFLSPIFKWYGSDFDKNFGTVQNFVAAIMKVSTTDREVIKKDVEIKWTKYSWKLNEWK